MHIMSGCNPALAMLAPAKNYFIALGKIAAAAIKSGR
jgi:hypothetical protein